VTKNNPLFLQFSLVNPETAKADGFGYANVSMVLSISTQVVPNDAPARQMRGKTVTVIALANGNVWTTFEPYDSVAERLLRATEGPLKPEGVKHHMRMPAFEAEEQSVLIVGGKPS
jgi:nitrogen fixation protein FixH